MEVKASITATRGLHARPIASLCSLTRQFDAKIWLSIEGRREVSASDMLAVMGMNIKKNHIVKIRTEGVEEEKAALEVKHFLEEMQD